MAGFNSNLYFALKLSYRSWEKSWHSRDNKTGISNNEKLIRQVSLVVYNDCSFTFEELMVLYTSLNILSVTKVKKSLGSEIVKRRFYCMLSIALELYFKWARVKTLPSQSSEYDTCKNLNCVLSSVL